MRLVPSAPLLRLLIFLLPIGATCQPSAGPFLPLLDASQPANGATGVSTRAWIVLDFAADLPVPLPEGFLLGCASEPGLRSFQVSQLGERRVVVDPDAPLPAGDACTLMWGSVAGRAELNFQTAAAGAPFRVLHDRRTTDSVAPYPDDFFLVEDPSTVTGFRHAVPAPSQTANHLAVFDALLAEANLLDGFSPIGPIVVALDDAVDAASLPLGPDDSLDPLATAALVDLTPSSPTFGERIPFRTEVRNDDETPLALVSHTLILFPSIPLEPGGRYAFFLSRRIQAAPGRPLAPSEFFELVLGEPQAGEDPAITENRTTVADALFVANEVMVPGLQTADIAFAAEISVRSTLSIQDDVQVMRRHVLAAPPPAVHIDAGEPDSIEANPGANVAALVRGTWDAPEWRVDGHIQRDAEGRPVQVGTREACFRLALPDAALSGPVPVVMYQHGNPGEAETEVLRNATRFLAEAGYAVIGFTDILNREVSPPNPTAGEACRNYESPSSDDEARITGQVFGIVLPLLQDSSIADHWHQTLGEQLAFVRMIGSLDTLDVLPVGAPDGVPDLDPTQLLYMGISEGGNNGQAFVPYSPEVTAAALMVGGARLIEVLIHQQADLFLTALPVIFPALSPADIWAAASLFQTDFDRQDKHNHARFVYREPAEVPLFCDDLEDCLDPDWCDGAGHCSELKPSVLMVEGLDDSLVPNHTTESSAWQMGPLPHLGPVQRPVSFLDVVDVSISGNIDAETTAAMYQYVPVGVPGIPNSPGCPTQTEGHFCAQSATESRAQRLIFFDTALDPTRDAPVIVDPLPFYPAGTPLFPLPAIP